MKTPQPKGIGDVAAFYDVAFFYGSVKTPPRRKALVTRPPARESSRILVGPLGTSSHWRAVPGMEYDFGMSLIVWANAAGAGPSSGRARRCGSGAMSRPAGAFSKR